MDRGPRGYAYQAIPSTPALTNGAELTRVPIPHLTNRQGKDLGPEAWLQEALAKHSDLLLVDRIDRHAEAPILVARELPMPDLGALDLLYLDKSGVLTLVETKLAQNPQHRREVLAQIIDYATFLATRSYDDLEALLCVGDQPLGDTRPLERSLWQAARRGDPVGVMYDNWSKSFRATAEENLRRRRLRLVIAGDRMDSRLRDMMEFLLGGTHPDFQVALVEIGLYQCPGQSDTVLVLPSMYWSRTPPIPALEIGTDQVVWTVDTFLEQLHRNNADSPETTAMVEDILHWMQQRKATLGPNARLEGGKALPSNPSMNLYIKGSTFALPHLEGRAGGSGWISCKPLMKAFPQPMKAFLAKIQDLSPWYEEFVDGLLNDPKAKDFMISQKSLGEPAIRAAVLQALSDLQDDLIAALRSPAVAEASKTT